MSKNDVLKRITGSEIIKSSIPIITPEQSKNIMQNFIPPQQTFKQDPLISKTIEDANKRVRQSQDNIHKVAEYASRIHALEDELKNANSQLKVISADNGEQLTKIKDLNSTVEILKRDLEIAQLRSELSEEKLSKKDVKNQLLNLIFCIIGIWNYGSHRINFKNFKIDIKV